MSMRWRVQSKYSSRSVDGSLCSSAHSLPEGLSSSSLLLRRIERVYFNQAKAMENVPEDMENRRLAALEKFALAHPTHPMVPLLMKEVHRTGLPGSEEGRDSREGSSYHRFREQQLQPDRKGKRRGRKPGGKRGASNKWDKASSLELLAEAKRFQDSLAELSIRGIRVTSDSRWAAIAKNLPNLRGLEPAKYARSCKVHFMNLCRVYRAQGKNSKGEDALDSQVRRALEDYFQLGDVNVPPVPPRKREVKTGVKRVGDFVMHQNASNVTSNQECRAMDETEKVALEKHSKRRPDKEGDPRGNENPHGVENIKKKSQGDEANQDPYEHEELGNPYRQQRRVSSPMDTGAILGEWDTASTLQLLATVRKVGPKVVKRWEVIASQLPNHCKLDHHEHVRSCKDQYRALLRIYMRENMQRDLGHRPLVDDVHAQLEKWLLLQSTTSKTDHLKRKESLCVERRDTVLERVGAKLACKPRVIPQNEEETGNPKAKASSPEKNRTGFLKRDSDMRNENDSEHHSTSLNDRSSTNDALHFDSDNDNDRGWDDYRRRIKIIPKQQDGEQQSRAKTKTPPTRTENVAGADDGKKNCKLQIGDGQGIYKTYVDRIISTSNKLRNTSEADSLKSSDFNQAVDIDKRVSKDHYVQDEYNQRNLKIRISKPILSEEAKLKKQQQQADAKERGLYKPLTHRILPHQVKHRDNNNSEDDCWLLERGGIGNGENSKGRKRRATDGDKMKSPDIESLEAETGEKVVGKKLGISERIIGRRRRADACPKYRAPLMCNSDSSRIPVAESDNVRSWNDSTHLDDSSQGEEIHSTIRNKSVFVEANEKTRTNIFGGRSKSNQLLQAGTREIEVGPAGGRLDNCVGLYRKLKSPLCSKIKLDSDEDDRSCDDSLHLDEDDSASEGDESKRKRKKRSLIMKRMQKKRAEMNKADNKRIR